MNLFHTLRQKAEFADIVFILMARSLCLTTQRNLTILQLERRCVCKRLAPYQISQEKMTARLGTLRRSFFLAFFIVMSHTPFLPCPGTSPGSKNPPCWYLAARRVLLLSYKSKNKSGISNRFSGRITNLFCSSPRIFQGSNLNCERPCSIFHRTVFVDFNRHYLIIVSIDSSSYHCSAFIHTGLQ